MKQFLPRFSVILLILLAFAAYANHFNNSFHFDDEHTIVNNITIRNLHNLPRIFSDATAMSTLPANQSYRPLLTASTAVDFYLSGKQRPEPFVFHITSFILFVALGLILYYLIIHFLQNSSVSTLNKPIAFFTAAWFLLHTANAETVNYIIARSDIMSTFFIVTALTGYVYFSGWRKYYIYLIPVILGLLSKEQAIVFIPIIILYKIFFEQNLPVESWWSKRKTVIHSIATSIIPIIVILLCFLFVRKMTAETWRPGGADKWPYIFTQPFVIFHYCYNFLLPVNLVADTDWTVISSYTDDRILAGLLLIFLLIAIIIRTSRDTTTRPIAFGIAWFLLALAPTSLLPFAEVLNDHRTFLPYIGLFIAAAACIRNLLVRYNLMQRPTYKWMILSAAFLILLLHGIGVHQRNNVWSTEETLWKEVTEKAPGNGRGWMNYGVALMSRGDFQNAENCFNKTVALWPYYSRAYANLGVIKQFTGTPQQSEENFKKALLLDKNIPAIYALYGRFLTRHGRYNEAEDMINKGLQLSPEFAMLQQVRDEYIAATKQPAANPAAVNQSIPAGGEIKKASPETLINASLQYYNSGQFEKCIETAQAALQLKPGYDLAYNNLCAAYNRLKLYDKAIAAGSQGLKLNPSNKLLLGNLAEAYKLKNQH